jgi:phospholipid/cholesterol/gamma-HCH transport system ATP-binding protein
VEGQVLHQGRDLAGLDRAEILRLRQQVGFVFQNSALISNMTVWDNIALPLQYHRLYPPDKIKRVVQTNIDLVGLQGFESYLPANLSMGSQKRAALARALVTYPAIVFYDEPTSGLDPMNAQAVTEVIRSLQTGFGITSMVVTHDIASAFRLATKIGIVRDHKIYFTGTVEEIRNSADPYIRRFISTQTEN